MSAAAALLLAALAAAPAPAPVAAHPAPRPVHSRLSKANPRLGEPFTWEVELRHPPAEVYSLPSRLDLAPFEAEPGGCRRAAAGEETVTTCALTLRVFTLGAKDVPAIGLDVATPKGPAVLEVPGPRVEAAGVIDPAAPAEQLQLRDPAPPVSLVLPSWAPAWWGLGALGGVALLWLLWRLWRGRARAAAAPPPPVPPGVRLARRLDALEAERLGLQGRAREHFFRLSEAVRDYVGALTGLNALDLTTAELCDALSALGDPRFEPEALRGFLEDADLIKFARFPAGGAECEAGLRFARDLLARTAAPAAAATT